MRAPGARQPQVVEEVVAKLEQLVADEQLQVGDRLPTERVLVSAFKVSRSTVREALRELELKGRIERVQGRGTTVAASWTELASGQALLGELDPGERQVAELMDFRHALEPVIARRAARYATPADIYALAQVTDKMTTTDSAEEFRSLDERFHYLVARATHNSAFVLVVETSWKALRPTRLMQTMLEDAGAREESLQYHLTVLEAIRERDADKAERAMRIHIERVARELGVMVEGDAPKTAEADGAGAD